MSKKTVFLPDDYFYIQYYEHADKDPVQGLHYMTNVLFDWLKINPNSCLVDFYDEETFENKSADAAGLYTKIEKDGKEQEVILINSKHAQNPFDVAAILAHEMMHLYLYRNDIELEDTQENEQLTDLATIQAGLSVLILNGMSKDTRWLMTIIALCFGMLYWHSEQKAFGYFQPKQYGQQARRYFGEKNIPLPYIIGHVLPAARFFIPGGWRTRAQKKTKIIEMFEKRRLRANLIEVAIAIIAIGALIGFVNWEEQKDAAQRNLSNEIVNCKSEAESMEASMDAKEARLESIEAEMGRYEASGNNRRYNELVEPYNQLLREIQNDYAAYDKAVDDCNASINNYNSNL